MINFPAFFRSDTNARVVLHVDQSAANPVDNLENLASEATAEARKALSLMRDIQPASLGPGRRSWELLRKAVRDRHSLSDGFRDAASELAETLRSVVMASDKRAPLESAAASLDRASELSHRVADLLAAEIAIGRTRGVVD